MVIVNVPDPGSATVHLPSASVVADSLKPSPATAITTPAIPVPDAGSFTVPLSPVSAARAGAIVMSSAAKAARTKAKPRLQPCCGFDRRVSAGRAAVGRSRNAPSLMDPVINWKPPGTDPSLQQTCSWTWLTASSINGFGSITRIADEGAAMMLLAGFTCRQCAYQAGETRRADESVLLIGDAYGVRGNGAPFVKCRRDSGHRT